MNRILKKICQIAAAGALVFSQFSAMKAAEAASRNGQDLTYYNAAQTPAADPYVLYDEASGYYYAYSTDGAQKGYMYGIYRSPDLAVWERAAPGALKSDEKNRWGKTWFWAPEVYHNEDTGKYFMFYAAMMKDDARLSNFGHADFAEACKVGVAVSDRPEGPFESIADHPIDYYPYDPEYHDVNQLMDDKQMLPPATLEEGEKAPKGVYIPFIDPNVFFDEDGRIYLYYSRNAYRNWVWDTDLEKYIEESNIYAVELTSDWWNDPEGKTMPEIAPAYINSNASADDDETVRKDGYIPVISYSAQKQDWENAHVNDYVKYNGGKKNRRWAEGSTTFRKDADTDGDGTADPVYYMLYSCNNYENENYGIGYATASSPLGPWTKAENNPILQQDPQKGIYSTGHGSIIESPDGSELFYVYHGRNSTTSGRKMYADRLYIEDDNPDSSGIPGISIDESTTDQLVASGVGPVTLQGISDALLMTTNETRTLNLKICSAAGAAFDLSSPLNRICAESLNGEILTAALEGSKLVLEPAAAGNTEIRISYERLSSDGSWKTAMTQNIPVEIRDLENLKEEMPLHRLYNPNSGEHFFTGENRERDYLIDAGWNYEGIGWTAPVQNENPVYRLFNPNGSDHHFTLSRREKEYLEAAGWIYEGIAWNGEASGGIPVYRSYNPNAGTGAHHFTTSRSEHEYLTTHGWKDEGIAWYGMIPNAQIRSSRQQK